VCKKCGRARERVVEKTGGTTGKSWHDHENDMGAGAAQPSGGVPLATAKSRKEKENPYKIEFKGYTDCGCGAEFEPGIVIDPFMGSGTTGAVAAQENRNWLGIELNPEYIEIAKKRIAVAETGVPVKEQKMGQGALFNG